MDRTSKHQPRTSRLSRPGARRLAGFAVITAIALIFVFENTTSVRIRLLVPEVTMPLWGALLIAWGLGVVGAAFTVRRRR